MKTSPCGWNIVHFNDDNTVAAVPDTWLNKNICAWPKNFKDANKIIESRMKPNEKEFYFYNVKNMSKKTYGSLTKAKSKLPKALLKSDISCTEEDEFLSKERYKLKRSYSPNLKKAKKNKTNIANQHQTPLNGPPCYIPQGQDIRGQNVNCIDVIQSNEVSDSDSSIFDDSDVDPTWESKKNTDLAQENVGVSLLKTTPLKSMHSTKTISSPSGIWNVSQIDREESPEKRFNETKSTTIPEINLKFSDEKTNSVKRQLQYSETNQNQIKDLYDMSLTSFTFLKYEMQALKMFCHTMNQNIEALIKDKSTLLSSAHDNLDIESLIPIKNNEDLLALEDKIKDKDLRSSLVRKISLFVGKKDVGNSVRRIMGRLFDDRFLINYSLYGFKQKQSFTKLSCYHLIIDALRMHLKYQNCTEKEIDEPMGTWLSHAPYRIKDTKPL